MSIEQVSDAEEVNQAELLSAARRGSSEALGALLETLRGYLLSVGQRELPPALRVKVAPSDLVQQTFVEAQRSLANFEGQDCEQFKAWLRGILLNQLMHAHRFYVTAQRRSLLREAAPDKSSTSRARAVVDQGIETPSRAAVRAEEIETVQAAMARLPEHYRQVILLRNFDLFSFADIGVMMNRSVGAAQALWGRAMLQLKEELDGSHED